MRAFIILCCLVIKATAVQEACEGVLFDGKYYEREIINNNLDKPYQMVVDKKTNTLYFSFSVGTNEEDDFRSGSIDLNNNKFTQIADIENGFAAAVDQEKGIVYLGGSDGIYVLDTEGKGALHTDATEENIWVMFFKDELYFVDYPDQKLHTYRGGEPRIVPEFAETSVTQFAIDKEGERFFTNDTGLYGVKMNSSVDDASLYDSKITVRGITLNNEGKAYFCGIEGIFTLDKERKIKNIAAISNVFGMAFDKNDNVIYASSDKIIKLIPSSKNCTVLFL